VRVVVEVPVYLGMVGSAGCKEKDPNLAAERIDNATDEFLQNISSVFMAALHKIAEQGAAEGAGNVGIFHVAVASARPGNVE
jgi:hypothetical protein